MANDTTITLIGNLTDDPELRFTPSGAAVAKFRVASTPRFMDKASNEWKDGEPLFLSCEIWRTAAENVAESLRRGDRVILSGRLKMRTYETTDKEKRTVYEVEVDEIGPSLRYAQAKVVKQARSDGGSEGGRQQRTAATRPEPQTRQQPAAAQPARQAAAPAAAAPSDDWD